MKAKVGILLTAILLGLSLSPAAFAHGSFQKHGYYNYQGYQGYTDSYYNRHAGPRGHYKKHYDRRVYKRSAYRDYYRGRDYYPKDGAVSLNFRF